MSIFSPALKGIFKLRQSGIENYVLNPIDSQTKVFHQLIGSAQYTEFGKEYNFSKINSISDFQKFVPINDYDLLKPYIHRILEGHQNVLWSSEISWFAKSSGTTSDKSKFIPISKESLDHNHFKSGKDVLSLYLSQFPESKIMSGKCLVIGGSHQLNQLNADSYYGDLSAVMLQNMPFLGQIVRTPDLSIALMEEWEEKIEKMAQATMKENVTFMTGVPTWSTVLIKKIFEISGTKNLHEIWPNFELYIHGGVSFKPYRQQYEQLIPNPSMHYLETYNASEGFIAAQDNLADDGMLLFLNHGIFYEFLPIESVNSYNPKVLTLKEVEIGKTYALLISTNAGLWRYLIGDTIQFTSIKPFKIKITGRTKQFINAFGEEVIVENAEFAIAESCRITGAVVNDFTAAPVFFSNDENGTHEWIIDFENLPVSIAEFTEKLDKALQSVNSDYEAKRYKNIALRMPIVHQMPKGGFNEWLKSKGKLGGQNKVPRLSNDRKWMDEILTFMRLTYTS